DFAKFSELVSQHCDFVYLGKGLKSETRPEIIIAYEKPGPQTPDGLNLAFQDGHSEFTRWPAITTAFEATNAYLKKNGKMEVDVKSLMKAANIVDGMPMP
ncbi:MAG TPA: hypothetical protein VGN88_06000, partial [Phycisphaerae bacterium]